jgi:hypothetical protein
VGGLFAKLSLRGAGWPTVAIGHTARLLAPRSIQAVQRCFMSDASKAPPPTDNSNNPARAAVEKLDALLKHYDIEQVENPWLLLAFELAWDFVPGFAPGAPGVKRGRPKGAKTWTTEERDQLIAAVQAVKSEKKERSIVAAIRLLKQREPSRWQSVNEARYYEAVRDRKDRDAARNEVIAGNYFEGLKRFFATEK